MVTNMGRRGRSQGTGPTEWDKQPLWTGPLAPSVGRIVELALASCTPHERDIFKADEQVYQLRPATLVRKHLTALEQSGININRKDLAFNAAGDRQFRGLAIIIDTLSGYEYSRLVEAVDAANELVMNQEC